MKRVLRRHRTVLGRLMRDIDRELEGHTARKQIRAILERARRLRAPSMKAKDKLYALHAPEVECIGKGKAWQPYEFGVKLGIAIATSLNP